LYYKQLLDVWDEDFAQLLADTGDTGFNQAIIASKKSLKRWISWLDDQSEN
jgi:hypothetical protein